MKNFRYPIRSFIGFTAVFLSIAGSILLIYRSATQATPWHVVAFSIYGLSLIALWTASSLYHSLDVPPAVNRILEQLDHAMIYFLIAGTYTPICLIVLRGAWGWSLFGINWALAVTGMVLKLSFREPSKAVTTVLFVFYLIMGWLIVMAWSPLVRVLAPGGVFWLVLGGIFYTVGTVFFNLRNSLNFTPKFGAHDIWHIFVLAGSLSHYWLMSNYILYLGR